MISLPSLIPHYPTQASYTQPSFPEANVKLENGGGKNANKGKSQGQGNAANKPNKYNKRTYQAKDEAKPPKKQRRN